MNPRPERPAARAASGLLPSELNATVVLLRHGESEWIREGRFQGQGDPPLSALGRRQASLAAERLAHPRRPPALPIPTGPPIAIRHSPLSRTAETAQTVAAAMAAPSGFGVTLVPEGDPGFIEIGQGAWEGLPGATIAERWATTLEGWREDPLVAWAPGGESLPEVDERVRRSVAALFGRLGAAAPASGGPRSHVLGYADGPGDEPWALAVGHDGVFKVTLLALLDLPLARFWSFPFALCGITVVEVHRGRARLRVHNATDHLAPLEAEAAQERDTARERDAARERETARGRAGAL